MSKLELNMDKEIYYKQEKAFKNIQDELKYSKAIVDNEVHELSNSKFFKILNLIYSHHHSNILHNYKH